MCCIGSEHKVVFVSVALAKSIHDNSHPQTSGCICAIDDDDNRVGDKRLGICTSTSTGTPQGPEKSTPPRHQPSHIPHSTSQPHTRLSLMIFRLPEQKFLRLVSLHAHVQAQELCLAASHQERRQEAKSTVVSLAKVLLSVIHSFTYSLLSLSFLLCLDILTRAGPFTRYHGCITDLLAASRGVCTCVRCATVLIH